MNDGKLENGLLAREITGRPLTSKEMQHYTINIVWLYVYKLAMNLFS